VTTIDILTALLVLITAIYAWLTYRMARATEQSTQAIVAQSEAMSRPYITISPWVRPKANFFYLKIANTGRTAAANVRLTLDRDFYQFGEATQPDRNLRTKTAFSQAIDSVAPGVEMMFCLGQGWVVLGDDTKPHVTPSQFNVTASYQYLDRTVTEVTRIDLRPYIGSEVEPDPLVEELERIRKVLEGKLGA
jgi:hypothetical protein